MLRSIVVALTGVVAAIAAEGSLAQETPPPIVIHGVPAAEAIKAATANGAEILGMQDRIGRIKSGFEADLIAVAGDPLQDIAKLRTVSFVMKGGAVQRAD